MGKQDAADDGLAASGGQLEHQPPFGMIRQSMLNSAEKILLIGAELAHDDAILSMCRPVSNTELRPVTVQSWWVELAEGGLPNAGAGGGGYVIYRAWILKLT